MLAPIGEEIWTAEGPEVEVAGFHYPLRMAVIRLGGGSLFIWSPVALDEGLREDVAALGTVRFLVAPNSLHHLYLAEWKSAFPEAEIWGPARLAAKRKDLTFDGILEDAPPAAWEGEIDQVLVTGNLITDEAVFFHEKSGTVIFTDLLQHFPPGWFSGWRALIAKLDLMTGDEPHVPRKFRRAFIRRRAAREALRRVLAWPASQVLMAHGAPVRTGARAFLERAFRWLF
ncbi:DUF4336 domain-containing protein [Tepidicaulis sp.]|uniref:DUF4336 domain-containing protein n=1 Tax=Tepidicaulis sp. TaxID=1920809 RepID=UPI003B596B06